ncbi:MULTISPECIES: CdaR family protein [Bacillus]|uniref:CdaR family protein n=1 Tax=Bacillus TaxID=1386 RepID=UPI00042116FE|nr:MULTISPECIES: YbbR-like domain-containing protein [Bacillus]QHZ48871.1 YbbR-like domain-containing protein [Bacillus sp. NSP9.1]
MDKFLNNPWAVKVVALLFAFLLYFAVHSAQAPTPKKPGESFFPTTTTDEATLTDIPVKAYYDDENYVVTGVPQTVNVTIKGPTGTVKKVRQVKDFEVYADMQDLKTGRHKVELKARNVADGLSISINPSVTTVTIEEKTSKEFPVEVDFYNKNKMKDGYTPEQPIVNPKNVSVTGSKAVIDRIASIKATINLEGIDQSVEREAKLTVYDRDGNVLPVEVDPSVVNITVPVTSPSKKVPIKLDRKGSLPDGISISSVDTSPGEVTVYGPENVLDSLEFVDGPELDLSKIKDDTELEADVPVPDGAKKVSPEKVKIKVKVDKEEDKELKNVSIKAVGLNDSRNLEFLDPKTGKLDITAKGSEASIENLQPSDIELYINVADLDDGEHDVKLEVNGPQNVAWSLPQKSIKVRISSKTSQKENDKGQDEKEQDHSETDSQPS